MSWTIRPNPFDGGFCMDVAYSTIYDRLVAVGTNAAHTINVITSDDHGLTWVSCGNVIGGLNPYGAGVACSNSPDSIVVFGVVSNGVSLGRETVVVQSDDGGATWGAPFIPLGPHGVARRVRSLGSAFTTKRFVAGGDDIGGVGPIFSSLDGIAWTVAANPAGCHLYDVQVIADAYWLATGKMAGNKVMAYSTNPALTGAWTIVTSPMDGASGTGLSLASYLSPITFDFDHVIAVGGKSPTTYVMTGVQSSWTARHTNPFDSKLAAGKSLRAAIPLIEGAFLIGGDATSSPYTVLASSKNGYTFAAETTPFDVSGAYINGGFYRNSFGRAIVVGQSGSNTIMTGLPTNIAVPTLNCEFSI